MTTTIDNEQKTLNVPNLRFPEFEGEWEENYVNEICNEFKSGKAIKADLILDVGTYPVFGGNGLRGYTSTYNHDGLFVLIGRQGALCGNVRSVIGKTYITEHAIAVNGNNKSDTNFLHYLFLQMDLGRFSDQSAQPGLAVNKLLKLKVITPRIDEQRKIANLLRLLDERIATQNKIIEELKKLKVCVRRLIFRTLNCSWFLLSELEASGDICLKRGNIIPKHEHTDIFCYPVYSSSVQNGGLMGYNNTYMFNTELVTWSIDGGGNFFYRHKHKFNVTNVSGYMQLNEAKYNYRFVSEILLWQHSFMVFDYQTKAHPSVIRSIYKLPDVSLAEQELIANIFRLLDVKLQNEMTILKQYQQQKQYLLRQMFI